MTNKDKYLIVSDLDGTLLNNDSNLSKSTIQSVKKIINDGHIFCIATGRPLRSSIDIYKQLNLKSLMINHNGSYISNPSDINFKPIDLVFSKNIAIHILENEKIREIISNAFVEVNNKTYTLFKTKNSDLREYIFKYYHIDILDKSLVNLNGKPKKLKDDVYAILLYVENTDSQLFDKLIYHVKTVSEYLQVRMVKLPKFGIMIEINTKFADKAMGVDYLASYYGITKDKILTFGDGDNDMRMLSEVKYGFAMKNGKDTAKMSARHITKFTNQDNGVVWEIEYFMEEKK